MGNRIVISGYYGFGNLGDEAVLYSMLQALRREMPHLEIVVLSNDPEATSRDHGVLAVNRWQFGTVIKALHQGDLLLSGGGSLLQDITGLKSLLYYLGVILLARFLRKPVMYYAQGIGPVNTALGRKLTCLVTQGVNTVSVRDEESLADLRAMGLQRPIEVTVDPLLGLRVEEINTSCGASLLNRYGVTLDKPVVGVAPRPVPGKDDWLGELAYCCDELVRLGNQVVFIPLHYPHDLLIAQQIIALMKEHSVLISEQLSVIGVIALISQLNLLIGLRLHALVFAAIEGVPPLGIVYDPKVERFLTRLGMSHAGTPQSIKGTYLAAQAVNFLSNEDKLKQNILNRVCDLRSAADETARLAISLLQRT